MIALAQYPSGLKLDQTALSFYYKSLVNATLSAQSKKYSQALDHFLDVRKWCELNCKYPYSIEISDLLFDGVRVRIGSYDDFVYVTTVLIRSSGGVSATYCCKFHTTTITQDNVKSTINICNSYTVC